MANYVKFLRGTPAAFDKLVQKDANTLYFIAEKDALAGSLFLGATPIITGSEMGEMTLSSLLDVLINKEELSDGSLLVYDYAKKAWVNKSWGQVMIDVMIGATETSAGRSGLVPEPQAGDQLKFLRGDGIWADESYTIQEANKLNTVVEAVAALTEGETLTSIRAIALDALAKALIPDGAKESLDTLQEIAAWIQDHPDDVAAMNQELAALRAELNSAKSDITNLFQKIDGTLDVPGLLSRTATIEDILNDTTAEDGSTIKGLVSKVEDLMKVDGDTGLYVTKGKYLAEVGNFDQLTNKGVTLVEEINSINARIAWQLLDE